MLRQVSGSQDDPDSLRINCRCQNRRCNTFFTTIGCEVKQYPPDVHAITHESNPVTAVVVILRGQLKKKQVPRGAVMLSGMSSKICGLKTRPDAFLMISMGSLPHNLVVQLFSPPLTGPRPCVASAA